MTPCAPGAASSSFYHSKTVVGQSQCVGQRKLLAIPIADRAHRRLPLSVSAPRTRRQYVRTICFERERRLRSFRAALMPSSYCLSTGETEPFVRSGRLLSPL